MILKAKELDPGNELYVSNVKIAEEKLKESQERSSSASQGMGWLYYKYIFYMFCHASRSGI